MCALALSSPYGDRARCVWYRYDILLLKAEYIIDCWRAAGRLSRRQDLPTKAFYKGPLEYRTLVVISHPWLSKGHPDPDGWLLSRLGRLLELFCDNYGNAAVFIDCTDRTYSAAPTRVQPAPARACSHC